MTVSFTDDVYATLEYLRWKSGRVIREEVCKIKGIENSVGNFRAPSYGRIYVCLRYLVEQGFAEVRDSEDPDGRMREYKRATGRLRAPDKEKKQARQGLGGLEGLVPA